MIRKPVDPHSCKEHDLIRQLGQNTELILGQYARRPQDRDIGGPL